MGPLTPGQVVVLPFPYSDLSRNKVRPAILLGKVGDTDWLACQITSNPFADPKSIRIDAHDFVIGTLHQTSYIRPGKLFTADEAIILRNAGKLSDAILEAVRKGSIEAVYGR